MQDLLFILLYNNIDNACIVFIDLLVLFLLNLCFYNYNTMLFSKFYYAYLLNVNTK